MVCKNGGVALLTRLAGALAACQLWPGVSAQWTRQNMALDTSCSSNEATYLQTTMSNIESMLTNTRSALATIKSNLGTGVSDLSDADRAKFDLFTALYRLFDPTKEAEISTATTRIEYIDWFAQQLLGGLTGDALDIRIFCNDDHLVAVNAAQSLWQSSVVPTMVLLMMDGKCEDNPGTRAFMQETIANADGTTNLDVMTICPDAWDEEEGWLEHLSQHLEDSLEDLEDQDLDGFVSISGEINILHELTHTVSFFTQSYVMDDISQGGVDGYKWAGCFNLAQEGDQDQAVNNAESFAYLNAGFYLSQCNWKDGTCQDPATAD